MEGTHEAVIDREMFDLVQELLKRDTRTSPEKDVLYVLSGFVFCAACGQGMVRKRVRRKSKEYVYYVCGTHKSGRGCASHSIPEAQLKAAVLTAVRDRIRMAADMERLLEYTESLPEQKRSVKRYDVQIVKLKEELKRNEEFEQKLYESLKSGLIDQNEYLSFKKNYEEKIRKTQRGIEVLEKERRDALEGGKMDLGWLERIVALGDVEAIDRPLLTELVSGIYVYDDRRVEVVFRFAEEWKAAENRIQWMTEEKGA